MRCPKCGFTSFDHLETCKKCHKFLGSIITELNGTAHDSTPPLFLTIAADKEEEVPVSAQPAEGLEESSTFENEVLFSMEEVEAVERVPEEEQEQPQPQEIERIEIEFAGFDGEMELGEAETAEAPANGEMVLEADEPAEKSMPAIDFGELDISDLAPPAAKQAEPIRFEPQPALTDLEPVAALSSTQPPQSSKPSNPPSAGKSQAGLEDLNTNGLVLDAPSKLITGSAAGKRFLPSVKTGTALDKFDVDLGDLFANNKK